MNAKRFGAFFEIVFGIALVILTLYILPFCKAMGEMVMRCHASQVAESVAGAVIFFIGIATLILPNKVAKFLQAFSVIVGIFVALVPVAIFGTCANAHMHCHAIAAPVLLIAGIVFALVSLVGALLLQRRSIHEIDHR